MGSAAAGEVVKWYTRARKFPHLIGRTPDGAKIWGGPYTLTQAVGAGVMLFVGVNTTSLWARYGLLGNAGILLGASYALVLALGRIPVGSRNPVSVLAGGARALGAPRAGRLGGRPVRLHRPRRLRHHLTLQTRTPTPVSPVHPARVPSPALARASTRASTRVHLPAAAPSSARTHPSNPAPAPGPAPAPAAAPVPASSSSPENAAAPGAPVLTSVQSLLARAARSATASAAGGRAGARRGGGR